MTKFRHYQLNLKFFASLFWVISLLLFGSPTYLHAAKITNIDIEQNKTVTGNIISAGDNMSIPGVNVLVKGTSTGAVTDFDGNYSINIPSNGAILVFSYIGYVTQEVIIGTNTTINVTMESDIAALDEVVVVGYGTQKKATLTGAVEVIKSEAFEDKAITNPILALQGATPGLVVSRTSSRPGAEGADFSIRGNTSINGGSSLVVVDGVPGADFARINPDDIESISVLKDAAASIYGARAANGVILVTTKKGRNGKMKIEATSQVRVNSLGIKPQNANAHEYFSVWLDALESDDNILGDGAGNPWAWLSKDNVRSILNTLETDGEGFINSFFGSLADPNDPSDIRTDLYLVPNDRWDEIYGTSYSNQQNISISGGTDKIDYRISGLYQENVGPIDVTYDGQVQYNIRSVINAQVTDRLKVGTNISFANFRLSQSSASFSGNNFTSDPQIFASQNPFGQWLANFNHVGGGRSVVADIVDGGRTFTERDRLNINLDATYKITDHLDFKATAAFLINRVNTDTYRLEIPIFSWDGSRQVNTLNNNNSSYFAQFGTGRSKVYGAYLNYKNTFKENHNITATFGVNTENNSNKTIFGNRNGFEDQGVYNLSIGETEDIPSNFNGGVETHEGLYGMVGNITYDYQNKYLLTLTGRRDGSSRFSQENRWDNFLSASAGWVLSKEKFMENIDFLDFLKLRVSYGESANGLVGIGRYDYISTIASGNTLFGYTPLNQANANVGSLTSDDRKWERVEQKNIGIDFTILNNKLSGSFDYFTKDNPNMFIGIPFPHQLGENPPTTNNGVLEAEGWEASLKWKDNIGDDFNYNVSVFVSDTSDEIIDLGAELAPSAGINGALEGHPIGSLWTYKTDGIFQNQDEVDEYYNTYNIILDNNGRQMAQGVVTLDTDGNVTNTTNSTTTLSPGDIRKVDVNEDGRIDQNDLVFVGDVRPHYNFALNLAANYKGFDIAALFQGVGEQNVLRSGRQSYPFQASFTNHTDVFLGDQWTPENTDATLPRSSTSPQRNSWNFAFNDFRVQNNRYIRLKTLTLGYTLPKIKISNFEFDKVRIYFSGQDLWEASNLDDGFDPEYGSASNNTYPFTRVWAFGVNVNF